MLTVVTIVAFAAVAHAIVRRIDAGPFEHAAYVLLIGASLWLASVWLLALPHVLIRPLLIARTIIAAALAVVCWRRAPIRIAEPRDARAWFVIAPLALWIAFVLVRAAIVPPLSHDALAYHLPKAVLYTRAHGFAYFPFLTSEIRGIPANYEMLLADSLTLEGNDAISEWITTYFYVAFVIASAALVERWWRRGRGVVIIATAALPVALLQAGAHKNDLMTAAFTIGGVVAAGHFFTTRELPLLYVASTCFAAGIGTKPQPAIVAIATVPFVLWKLRDARAIALLAAFSIAALVLLGGVVYAENVIHAPRANDTGNVTIGTAFPWGDWSNYWQGAYVLIAAPFSRDPYALHVPWASSPWFWRRYELYFSHLGIPFACCLALFPIGLAYNARRATPEALTMTAACAAALLVIVPTHFDPHGMFTISLPRYLLFIAPVVLGWTIAPLGRFTNTIGAVLLAFFVYYAIDFTRHDRFEPWDYVVWAASHPGTRVVPFDPYRAACVVDRIAGPHDTIAIDAAFGSWLYPAFGATLERKVDFVQNGAIPHDAQWVIVDRGFQTAWLNPAFRDLSQARQFLMRGRPSPRDLRVVQQLLHDPRFQSVYYNSQTNQAVFRRMTQ